MLKTTSLCLVFMFAVTLFGNDLKKPEKSPRVLLAFEQTRFKSELIEEMKKQLAKAEIEIVVKEHSKEGLAAKAADFDAIFITNSGVRSQVRPWIIEWLAENNKQKDRILLHTTQTSGWKINVEVDAVTSASSRGEVKQLATDYVNRIKKILEK